MFRRALVVVVPVALVACGDPEDGPAPFETHSASSSSRSGADARETTKRRPTSVDAPMPAPAPSPAPAPVKRACPDAPALDQPTIHPALVGTLPVGGGGSVADGTYVVTDLEWLDHAGAVSKDQAVDWIRFRGDTFAGQVVGECLSGTYTTDGSTLTLITATARYPGYEFTSTGSSFTLIGTLAASKFTRQ